MSVGVCAREDAVVNRLRQSRVLLILTVDDPDAAEAAAAGLAGNGVSCVEVALRTPSALECLERMCHLDGLLVGVGTVLRPEQAIAAAEAGAAFAVSPGTNDATVAAARECGLPIFPGVATPTEIEHALSLGPRTLKIFPAAQLGGSGFVASVAAVYPNVRFIPSGGIDDSTAPSYLALPSVVAVAGSRLSPTPAPVR